MTIDGPKDSPTGNLGLEKGGEDDRKEDGVTTSQCVHGHNSMGTNGQIKKQLDTLGVPRILAGGTNRVIIRGVVPPGRAPPYSCSFLDL